MSEPIIAFSTCESFEDARRIATHLVDRQLAACVNILPGVVSIYRWQGKVDQSAEVMLVIKSNRRLVAEIQREFKTLHPYELPELVVLPIAGGSSQYLAWLEGSLRPIF